MNQRLVPASVVALLATSALAGLLIFNDGAAEFETDSVISDHRARQGQVSEASQAILNTAESEKRDLTEKEQGQVEDLADEFDSLERQIGLRARVLAQNVALGQPRGRRTDPETPAGGEPIANRGDRGDPGGSGRVEPRAATARGTGGFRALGDFAQAVRMAAVGRDADPRLRNAAASTYGSESVGADGGFAVPPDFVAEIQSRVFGEDSLFARTDIVRTGGNSITLPVDNTTPWDSTGGIQAYWGGEASPMTQSKPKLEEETYKASKLHCLVPITEELLEDGPGLDSYLRKKAPEKMDYKISDAIVRGNGAGMPLGFLNSPALVTVAAVGGQASGTIVAANISQMWARLPASSRPTAVWICHPDAEPQFDGLVVGQQPVYLGPGGITDAAYGRIKGRPVIPGQVARSLGLLGDLMLVDLKQYMSLVKAGNGRDQNGMKIDTSMHLWFDQDLVAFKFTIRVGGQPWWSAPLNQASGTNQQSPFVVLGAR